MILASKCLKYLLHENYSCLLNCTEQNAGKKKKSVPKGVNNSQKVGEVKTPLRKVFQLVLEELQSL